MFFSVLLNAHCLPNVKLIIAPITLAVAVAYNNERASVSDNNFWNNLLSCNRNRLMKSAAVAATAVNCDRINEIPNGTLGSDMTR